MARRRGHGRGAAAGRRPDARGVARRGRPDGTRIAFAADRGRNHDLDGRSSIFVVDVASGDVTTIAGGNDALFSSPAWTLDGSRSSPWATGSRAASTAAACGASRPTARTRARAAGTDLLAASELKPDASMNSDVTIGEGARLVPSADGDHVLFRRRSREPTSCGGSRSTATTSRNGSPTTATT